jgi:hypothetical protein
VVGKMITYLIGVVVAIVMFAVVNRRVGPESYLFTNVGFAWIALFSWFAIGVFIISIITENIDKCKLCTKVINGLKTIFEGKQ